MSIVSGLWPKQDFPLTNGGMGTYPAHPVIPENKKGNARGFGRYESRNGRGVLKNGT